MLCPNDIKGIRSFLGHDGFYRRFIKDFSKISRPLTNILQKYVPFAFDDDCVKAFEILKKALIFAPIVKPPDWNLPFEIMCDTSDYAVGAVGVGCFLPRHPRMLFPDETWQALKTFVILFHQHFFSIFHYF